MKKRGFTLTELIGVIIILGLLLLLCTIKVKDIITNSRQTLYEVQISNIEEGLQNWAIANNRYLPQNEGETITITLGQLKNDGFIEPKLENPITNRCFGNDMPLNITRHQKNYIYEINEETGTEDNSCEDYMKLQMILNGPSIVYVEVGKPYKELGVSAYDSVGNNITNLVTKSITGSGTTIDTSKVGNEYTITYSVTSGEETASIKRTVIVNDVTPPNLTIPGNVVLKKEETTFDLMEGVSATDNSGNPVKIETKSNIAFGVPGEYTVTYKAKDSSGNETIKKRLVYVSLSDDKTGPTYAYYEIKNITTSGYDVYVYGVEDESGIDRVQFPTWTKYNGQDDLDKDWLTNNTVSGLNQGNGTYYFRVNTENHNGESGTYYTEIHLYDTVGNETTIDLIETQVPSITVEFVLNDSTIATLSQATVNVGYGAKYFAVGNKMTFSAGQEVMASPITVEGYKIEFDKWSSTTGTITENTTITAYFEKQSNTYTITYDANGGSNAPTSTSYTYNPSGSITLQDSIPYKKGHTFLGWGTSSNDTTVDYSAGGKFTTDIASNTTLYAIWEATTYKITYNANGGENAPSETTYTYAESGSVKLSTEIPIRMGYTFKGWGTSSDDTTVDYLAGAEFNRNITNNTVLYAIWSANTYKITYNANGGINAPNETTYIYAESGTVNLSSDIPTKEGYTFLGWGISSTDTTVDYKAGEAFNKNIANNTTLYAIWNANTYKVSYSANGGSDAPSDTTYTYDAEEYTNLTTEKPTREGYTFIGWSQTSNAQTPEFEAGASWWRGNASNCTLYAVWAANTNTEYTVYTYKMNTSGTYPSTPTETESKTGTTGTTINISDLISTILGFTYDYSEVNGEKVTTAIISPDGSTAINIYYSRDKYTVTLTKGTGISTVSGAGEYYYEETVTIDATVMPGYTWSGWTDFIEEETKTHSFKLTGNANITANATINTYTISYELNGGSAINPTTYDVETTTFTLVNPTKEGYTFTGWTGSNGTTPSTTVSIAKGSIGNKEYTANFTPITYTISYELNGGFATNPTSYNIETDTFTLTNPTKTGYIFTGWTGSNGDTPSKSVSIAKGSTGDKTYTAHFSANTYSISYNANGGTDAPSDTTYTYAESGTVSLSTDTPTRIGHTFQGWGVTKDDMVVNYNAGAAFNKNIASNTTLYAKWTANTYKVSYDANGGENAPSDTTYTYNADAYTTLSTTKPTKVGYTFEGWSETKDSATVEYEAGASWWRGNTSNYTLYAVWLSNDNTEYTVNHYLMNLSGTYPSAATATENKTGKTASTLTLSNLAKTYTGFSYSYGQVGGSTVTTTTISADGSRVINLYYTRTKYTVTLTKGTGISAVSGANEYYYGATVTINATVLNGYTWANWSGTHSTTTQKYTFNMPASNVSDIANATINTYTISYELNGGTATNPTSYNVTTATFTLTNPKREGYTFTGWTGSNGEAASTSVSIAKGSTGNKTYTANWTPDPDTKYTVNHYQMNTSGTYPSTATETESKTGTTASSLTLSNLAKTYTGFSYSYGQVGGSTVTTTTIAPDGTRVINLYYTRNKYTVTLTKGTGISAVSGAGEYYYGVSVTIGASVTNGYTWANWTGTHSTATQTYTFNMPASNVSDTANATINTYTITYNANDGYFGEAKKISTSFDNETITLGANVSVPVYASDPLALKSNQDYLISFGYWADGINPFDVDLYPDDLPQILPTASTTKQYYNWILNSSSSNMNNSRLRFFNDIKVPNPYNTYIDNINLYECSGCTLEKTNVVTHGMAYGNLPIPTRQGYTFKGWYTSATGGTQITVTTTATSNITYYAQWTANTNTKYTVNHYQMNTNGTYPTTATATESKTGTTDSTLTLSNLAKSYTGFTYSHGQVGGTTVTTTTISADGSRVINLYYTRTKYTVSLTKGTGISAVSGAGSYYYGASVTINASVSTGYTWANWSGTHSTTTQSYTFTMPASNVSDTANAALNTYTISYTLNGGAVTNPTSYNVTTETFTLINPTKIGYTFTGWTGSNGTTPSKTVTITKGSTGNRNYTANFTENTYTISYNLNGGIATNPTSYNASTATFTLANPTKTGHTFTGWTEKISTSNWTSGFVNLDTGVLETNSTYPNSVYSELIYLEKGVKYTLTGTNLGGIRWRYYNTSGTYLGNTSDAVFTPTENGYVRILLYEGCTEANRNAAVITSSQGTSVPIVKGSTGNRNYTANFTTNTYTNTITHVVYGGSPYAETAFMTTTFTAKYGETWTFDSTKTTTAPNGTTHTHYGTAAFAGTWTSYYNGSTITQPAQNATINCYYAPNTYTITYNMNGGTNNSANPSSYDVLTGVTFADPTKEGYTFAGWTNSSGSKITGINPGATSNISGSDMLSVLASRTVGNQTVNANFASSTFTISYNLNGGTANNPTSYNVETDTFTLNNPTKTGYTFTGWTGSNGTTPSTSVSVAKGSTGDKTYTANWTPTTYTISYNSNLGLPSGYKVLSYIESTGTQYIDTGYSAPNGFVSTIEFTYTELGGDYIVGSHNEGSPYGRNGVAMNHLGYWEIGTGDGCPYASTGPAINTKYSMNLSTVKGNSYLDVNGTRVVSTTDSTSRSSYNLWIFHNQYTHNNSGATTLKGKLYSLKIYSDSGTLVRNFIPVINASGTVGLYDLVGSKFYTNAGTGTFVASETYPTTYNVTGAVTLPNPSRTGYTFGGWYENSSFSGTALTQIAKGSTGNKTLYAKWTANTYKISYNANGGTGAPSDTTYTYASSGTVNLSSSTPTRTGYTFQGWGTSSGDTTVDYSAGGTFNKNVANNTTLYAIWTANTYKVSYDANGGTGAPSDTTYTYNADEYVALSTTKPTRPGYTFEGWSETKNSATAEYEAGASWWRGNTSNYTLYAVWKGTDTKYTVNHYLMNTSGTYSSTATETENKTGTTGSTITLSTLAKSYTGFSYSYGQVGGSTVTTTTIAADGSRIINLYYTRTKYTVTLTKGTGISAVSGAGSYYHGASVTIGATPSAGYTWSKWTGTHSTTTQTYTFTMPTSNVSDTANATLNTYTISYELNGGTATNPTSYNVTTATFTLTNPKREGYTFTGWTGSNGTTASTSVSITKGSTGNKTYTANWTPNPYTKYTVNHYQMNTSGTYPSSATATESKTGTTASTLTLSNLAKTYTGFTYSYGSVGGSTVTTTTIAADGTRVINLYYTRNKYTVSLTKGTGISAVSGAGSYYHGASVTIGATVSTGYTWSKWSGTHSTTTQSYTFTMPTSNVSDTASATINTYTISYTLNGGTATNPTTYDVTTATFTLNNPTRTGYTFTGWTGSNGTTASTSVSITKGSTGNKTYTANWTPIPDTKYTVNHYQMNTSGTYPSTATETESKTGTTAASLTLSNLAKSYTGFTYSYGSVGGSTVTTTTIAADGTRVINLYYTRNKYTVSLTKGTGISSVSGAGSYYYGASVTIGATVSTGYTWSKWSGTHSTTTQSYTFTMPASNVSDTANAALNTYSISYTLNGGTATNPTSYNVTTATFTLNNPTKTGYTFLGWTGSNDLSSGLSGYTASNPYVASNRDHHPSDEFTVVPGRTYRVFFIGKRTAGTLDIQGGIWYTAQTLGDYWDNYSGAFTKLEDVGNGYSKYYKDVTIPEGKSKGKIYLQIEQDHSGGSTSWNIYDMHVIDLSQAATIAKGSTGNKSYTANWIINTYTVTQNHYYLYDNTTWTHFNTTTDERTHGSSFAPYNVSVPTGYYAGNNYGYYDSSNSASLGSGTVGTNSFTVDRNIFVNVHYYPNTYTITYNANGGTGAPAAQSYIYNPDANTTLSSTKPTMTGYTFLGWSLDKNATSASYGAGTSWWRGNMGNYTLYAIWTPADVKYVVNHYVMQLDGSYPLSSTDTKYAKTGSTLSVSALANSYTGFTYLYGQANGTTTTSTTVLADGSRVINQYYMRNQYSVSLTKGTGISAVSGGGSYYYGASVTIDATVSSGYAWTNWTGTSTTTTKKYTFTMPASNVSYTANATASGPTCYKIVWDVVDCWSAVSGGSSQARPQRDYLVDVVDTSGERWKISAYYFPAKGYKACKTCYISPGSLTLYSTEGTACPEQPTNYC